MHFCKNTFLPRTANAEQSFATLAASFTLAAPRKHTRCWRLEGPRRRAWLRGRVARAAVRGRTARARRCDGARPPSDFFFKSRAAAAGLHKASTASTDVCALRGATGEAGCSVRHSVRVANGISGVAPVLAASGTFSTSAGSVTTLALVAFVNQSIISSTHEHDWSCHGAW